MRVRTSIDGNRWNCFVCVSLFGVVHDVRIYVKSLDSFPSYWGTLSIWMTENTAISEMQPWCFYSNVEFLKDADTIDWYKLLFVKGYSDASLIDSRAARSSANQKKQVVLVGLLHLLSPATISHIHGSVKTFERVPSATTEFNEAIRRPQKSKGEKGIMHISTCVCPKELQLHLSVYVSFLERNGRVHATRIVKRWIHSINPV